MRCFSPPGPGPRRARPASSRRRPGCRAMNSCALATSAALMTCSTCAPGHAVGDVVVDGVGEHHRLLLHIADFGTEMARVQIADVDSVDENLTLVAVVELHQQVDERRLAAARRADDADDVARLDCHAHVGEHLLGRSNEKLTLRNSMRPRMTSGFSPSSADCSGSASRMSRMRSAAASALW